jgi:arylsulfatase
MIDCLREHDREHKAEPFFAYLAFTVPQFPLQAPAEDIARYRDKYLAGWDVIRQQRYERQKKLGFFHGELSPREPGVVPYWNMKEEQLKEQISPGEVGQAVAWDSLTPEEQRFQATKMAIHAAMVDRMDREIGRVLDQLRSMGQMENTVIMFASDNGASAEFLNRGDKHDPSAEPGSGGSYLCLGPGWATAANTPLRLHKSWVHEGGISTPFIVHWPDGIAVKGEWRHTVGHVIDFVPTALELAGADATPIAPNASPLPGRSLAPAFRQDVEIAREFLFFHHEHNKALRIGDWKLVSKRPDTNLFELYNLAADRSEQHNLATAEPGRVEEMASKWKSIAGQFQAEAAEPELKK